MRNSIPSKKPPEKRRNPEQVKSRMSLRIKQALILSTFALSSMLTSCASTDNIPSEKDTISETLFETRMNTEKHIYEKDSQRIIDSIREEFKVEIISPLTWNEQENLPWNKIELEKIQETLKKLPPQFFTNNRNKPTHILLIREKGEGYAGVGGGYASREIVLYTSEQFSGSNPVPFPGFLDIWIGKTDLDNISYALAHEYGHSFSEAYPSLLEEWSLSQGWIFEDQEWINIYPENLFHFANADKYPTEDLSTKIGTAIVNPSQLPEMNKEFF